MNPQTPYGSPIAQVIAVGTQKVIYGKVLRQVAEPFSYINKQTNLKTVSTNIHYEVFDTTTQTMIKVSLPTKQDTDSQKASNFLSKEWKDFLFGIGGSEPSPVLKLTLEVKFSGISQRDQLPYEFWKLMLADNLPVQQPVAPVTPATPATPTTPAMGVPS